MTQHDHDHHHGHSHPGRIARFLDRFIGHSHDPGDSLDEALTSDMRGIRVVAAGHRVAEDVRHALLHGVGRLDTVLVHVDPSDHDGEDHHAELRHHDLRTTGDRSEGEHAALPIVPTIAATPVRWHTTQFRPLAGIRA